MTKIAQACCKERRNRYGFEGAKIPKNVKRWDFCGKSRFDGAHDEAHDRRHAHDSEAYPHEQGDGIVEHDDHQNQHPEKAECRDGKLHGHLSRHGFFRAEKPAHEIEEGVAQQHPSRNARRDDAERADAVVL